MSTDRNLMNLLRRLRLSKKLKYLSLLIIFTVSSVSFIDIFLQLDSVTVITGNIIAIILAIIIGGMMFYMSLLIKIIAYFRAQKENLSLIQELDF